MNAGIARDSDVTTLRHRDYYRMPLLWLIVRVTNTVVFESKGGRKGEGARGREREPPERSPRATESENQRTYKHYLC